MARELEAEVLHAVPPDEQDEYDLDPELRALAESRYVLVCRVGGAPSWFERIRSFLLRRPIEAVTLVADTGAAEGEELTASVQETDLAGVYEATAIE
jgi:hypothetical protein